jgi:hypothetical protein
MIYPNPVWSPLSNVSWAPSRPTQHPSPEKRAHNLSYKVVTLWHSASTVQFTRRHELHVTWERRSQTAGPSVMGKIYCSWQQWCRFNLIVSRVVLTILIWIQLSMILLHLGYLVRPLSISYHPETYKFFSLRAPRFRGRGCGTALQAGTSRVRSPMVSFEFFIDIILPAALCLCGWLSL